jgi:hypothetical protein
VGGTGRPRVSRGQACGAPCGSGELLMLRLSYLLEEADVRSRASEADVTQDGELPGDVLEGDVHILRASGVCVSVCVCVCVCMRGRTQVCMERLRGCPG